MISLIHMRTCKLGVVKDKMKILINNLTISLLILISSCSYDITRNYKKPNKNQIATTSCKVEIISKVDLFGLPIKCIGKIKLDDSGLTSKCEEKDAKTVLQNEACLIGANLINIIEDAAPDQNNTCYRCIADLYNYDLSLYPNGFTSFRRDTCYVNYNSEMNWIAFKNIKPDSINDPYRIYFNYKMQMGNASFMTGRFKDFKIKCIVYKDISYIDKSVAHAENTIHLSGLVKLSLIFLRQLRADLTEKNYITLEQVMNVRDSYVNKLKEEQRKYSIETNYGKDIIKQNEWNKKIEDLLNKN